MDQEMNEAIEFRTQDSSTSNAVGKLREFCSETTAHGFGRLASSTSIVEKFVWLACLLAALGYMTYQGIILVSDYLSYPVDVKVELRYTDTLDFPAVVVCNMNTVKKSAVKKAIEQGMMVSIYFKKITAAAILCDHITQLFSNVTLLHGVQKSLM